MTNNISKLNTSISITESLSKRTLLQIQSKQIFTSSLLSTEITSLSPEKLKLFVDTVIASITKEKEVLNLLERFTELLSLSSLEDATKQQFSELISSVDTAKRMKKSAELYFESTKDKPILSPIHIKLNHIKDNFFSILEGFLDMFGLTNLFDSTESSETRAKKMILLLGLISSTCAILIPLVGVAHGFIVIGIVATTLISFGLLYPSIRPMPHSLPEMENWTLKYREGNLKVTTHPPEALDSLANTVESNRQPLIIGQSGSGKSELAKSLVRAIEEGKYPALKGKHVFYVNTGKLTRESLNNISQTMGRHRENIILIFDNMHQGFTKEGEVGPKIEEMLESGAHFPHIIGITTDENYSKKISSESTFCNHFTPVRVLNSWTCQTQNIIQHAASKLPPLLINTEALYVLPQKAKQAFGEFAPMPKTALDILSQCKHRTSTSQHSFLDKKIERIRERLLASSAQIATGRSLSLLPYEKTDETELLETEIAILTKQKEEEQAERAQFFALREKLPKIKEKILKLATTLSDKSTENEKKLFLLLSHYFASAFEAMLHEEAARLEIKTEINAELIDSVIEEEQVRRAIDNF